MTNNIKVLTFWKKIKSLDSKYKDNIYKEIVRENSDLGSEYYNLTLSLRFFFLNGFVG